MTRGRGAASETVAQQTTETEELWPQLGLVLLRLGLGVLVFVNGVHKFGGWGGPGLEQIARRVQELYPIAAPLDGIIAVAWAAFEVIAGVGLVLGLATRLWAGLYALIAMLSLLTALGGVTGVRLGIEHTFLIFCVTGAYALIGGGPLSLDAWWQRGRTGARSPAERSGASSHDTSR